MSTTQPGTDELALSLLDVPSGLKELKICTGYRVGGKALEDFDPAAMTAAECVYETLPAWSKDLGGCKTFDDLPTEAQLYVGRIEQLVGRPVGLISVGQERRQTILHNTRIAGLA